MQSTQDLFTWKTQIGKKPRDLPGPGKICTIIEQLQELLTDPVEPTTYVLSILAATPRTLLPVLCFHQTWLRPSLTVVEAWVRLGSNSWKNFNNTSKDVWSWWTMNCLIFSWELTIYKLCFYNIKPPSPFNYSPRMYIYREAVKRPNP